MSGVHRTCAINEDRCAIDLTAEWLLPCSFITFFIPIVDISVSVFYRLPITERRNGGVRAVGRCVSHHRSVLEWMGTLFYAPSYLNSDSLLLLLLRMKDSEFRPARSGTAMAGVSRQCPTV